MSQRRQSLDALTDIAREARNAAAQLLASERSSRLQLLTQVELLERYRREYSLRLQEVMTSGIALPTLQDYQLFLASLDEALQRAHRSIAEQQQRVQQCQQNWQKEQHRVSSYSTLTKRLALQQRRTEQRLELRHSDEISTNTFARKRLQQTAAEQDTNEESS